MVSRKKMPRRFVEPKNFSAHALTALAKISDDKRLSDAAKTAWVTLYMKGYFSDVHELRVTVEEMSEVINKSVRSVHRIIKELEDTGYIKKKTIRNSLPGEMAIKLQFRRTVMVCRIGNKEPILMPSITSCPNIVNNAPTIPAPEPIIISSKEKHILPKMAVKNKTVFDKNGRHSSKYIYNNNILTTCERDNYRECVVNSCSKNKQDHSGPALTKTEQEINTLRGRIETTEKKIAENYRPAQAPDLEKIPPKLRCRVTIVPIDPKLELDLRQFLVRLQAELERLEGVKKTQELKKLEGNYVAKPGARSFNPGQLARLRGVVVDYELQNQIAYAVKQGSLRTGLHGQELSLDHGLNIAFKLIRLNRWETPIGYSA